MWRWGIWWRWWWWWWGHVDNWTFFTFNGIKGKRCLQTGPTSPHQQSPLYIMYWFAVYLDAFLRTEISGQTVDTDEDLGGIAHIPIEWDGIVGELVDVGDHWWFFVIGWIKISVHGKMGSMRKRVELRPNWVLSGMLVSSFGLTQVIRLAVKKVRW